jgi:hypothetical protein
MLWPWAWVVLASLVVPLSVSRVRIGPCIFERPLKIHQPFVNLTRCVIALPTTTGLRFRFTPPNAADRHLLTLRVCDTECVVTTTTAIATATVQVECTVAGVPNSRVWLWDVRADLEWSIGLSSQGELTVLDTPPVALRVPSSPCALSRALLGGGGGLLYHVEGFSLAELLMNYVPRQLDQCTLAMTDNDSAPPPLHHQNNNNRWQFLNATHANITALAFDPMECMPVNTLVATSAWPVYVFDEKTQQETLYTVETN